MLERKSEDVRYTDIPHKIVTISTGLYTRGFCPPDKRPLSHVTGDWLYNKHALKTIQYRLYKKVIKSNNNVPIYSKEYLYKDIIVFKFLMFKVKNTLTNGSL
jgi:hypothetical protein